MADEIRRIAAKFDQPLSEKDQDLIAFIKHKFAKGLKKDCIYQPEKVVARSGTRRVFLAPAEQGKSSCERRRELLSTGFFSPANKPYKPVGVVHTDNIDLFSSWLSPEDQASLKSTWDKKFGKKQGSTTTSSKFIQEKVKKEENLQVIVSEDPQVGKGLKHLRQDLSHLATIQKSLRCGRPLVLCLSEQTTSCLHSRLSLDKVSTAEGDALKPVPLSDQLDPEELAGLERMFTRQQENFSEQLQWIHKIFCAITQMRNRDLKTMVPLNSSYVNIIMKDKEKANVLLKHSLSSYNPQVAVSRRLVPLAPEDCQNITDVWEGNNTSDTPPESKSGRYTGFKSVQSRKKPFFETEAAEIPPWLALQVEESTSMEKKPQKPTDQVGMLDRAKTEFTSIKKALNYQIETDVFEKRKNREDRMNALSNALMQSKMKPNLSSLLVSLKSEFKEPKSNTSFWFAKLEDKAANLGRDKDSRFHQLLDKISLFQNFTNKKIPYSKEKFCLLVISIPVNQLLRPALQEALVFLANHVLQILPRQLKQWYQYLKLPFSVPTET